jgi:hypothetical protein
LPTLTRYITTGAARVLRFEEGFPKLIKTVSQSDSSCPANAEHAPIEFDDALPEVEVGLLNEAVWNKIKNRSSGVGPVDEADDSPSGSKQYASEADIVGLTNSSWPLLSMLFSWMRQKLIRPKLPFSGTPCQNVSRDDDKRTRPQRASDF